MSLMDFLRPKKTQPAEEETFKFSIRSMHCTACALNIDGALEEVPGVLSSSTSYAKAETTVKTKPHSISAAILLKTIKDAGYEAEQK